jgi:uncharacterized protein (TIGR02996 family)
MKAVGETRMTDGDALVAAVEANPDDEAPRLVYADWLDERGDAEGACEQRLAVKLKYVLLDPESDPPRFECASVCETYGRADRAEIIRTQCQFERLRAAKADLEEQARLLERIAALVESPDADHFSLNHRLCVVARVDPATRASVDQVEAVGIPVRGFLHALRIETDDWREHGRRASIRTPDPGRAFNVPAVGRGLARRVPIVLRRPHRPAGVPIPEVRAGRRPVGNDGCRSPSGSVANGDVVAASICGGASARRRAPAQVLSSTRPPIYPLAAGR